MALTALAGCMLASCSSAGVSPTASPQTLQPAPIPPATLPPSASPEPLATRAFPTFAPIPAVSAQDWTRGPSDAPVAILAYSDFQSEACAQLASILKRLVELHPKELILVHRHYPLLTNHDKSSLAAQAAESAGAQGLFWEMHDLLFARQDEWLDLTPEAFQGWILQAASEIGADAIALREDLEGGRFEGRVDLSFQQAVASGIPGIPFLFVNGEDFRLPPTRTNLAAAVELEILRLHQYPSLPTMVLSPEAEYRGRFETSDGALLVQLYPRSAPIAVNSFVYLAREGWFDRTYFHQVVPGILVEGGDPSGTGLGGPGYFFATELDPLLDFSRPGMVAMSAESPGTNGSRFFITLAPQPALNGSRTIVGRVLEGLQILEGLPARDPLLDLLTEPDLIIHSVTIEGP